MATIADIRHANLLRVIGELGSSAALARLTGSSPQYIAQIKARTPDSETGRPRSMGEDFARRVERCTGRPAGWMDEHHPAAGEEPAPYSVAQNLSHASASHPLPRTTREHLMSHDPPAPLFVLPIDTDALGAAWPRQLDVVWSTTRTPQPGKPVLLRDPHDRVHVRLFEEGRSPGQWRAVAASPHFVTFSSDDEGVRILGVYRGHLEPED